MTEVVANADKSIVVGREGRREDCLSELVSQGFASAAHREIVDAVRDGQRHIVDVVHSTAKSGELATEKVGAANALATATAELRLSKEILKDGCETRALIREEANRTRELVQSLDTQRVRDDLAAANASLLALRVQVGNPV